MCSMAINIASFAHLLKRVDFDAIVDHLPLTHIIKSKAEPAPTRIKRLLEMLSSYSFNLYYKQEKTWFLVTSYLDRNIKTAAHIKLYLIHLICKTSYTLDITI